MPVDICVAGTQGEIGYMIERMLRNVMNKHNMQRNIVSLISLVLVDNNDPAFQNPTKRIGKVYSKENAEQSLKQKKAGHLNQIQNTPK